MDTTLAWLGQEMQVSMQQLMAQIQQLEGASRPEQHQLLLEADALLHGVAGAVQMATQDESQLTVYLAALRKVLAAWRDNDRTEIDLIERQTVHLACQALYEYLDVVRRVASYSELALFPAYYSVCLLTTDTPHPQQLWLERIKKKMHARLLDQSVQHVLVEAASLRLTHFSKAQIEQHLSQIDSVMLSMLRGREAQNLVVAQAVCDMHLAANHSELDVAGSALLRGVLEALSLGYLELDLWLKKTLLASLDWLKGNAECPFDSLAFFVYVAWQYETAQNPITLNPSLTSSAQLSQIAQWCDWTLAAGVNYNRITLGRGRSEEAAQLLEQLTTAKRALAAWSTEGQQAGGADRALLELALLQLNPALVAFHMGAESLAFELSSVVSSPLALQQRPVLIELATLFLTVETMLGQFLGSDSVQLDLRFAELARRLKCSREGQAAGAFAPWMLALQQGRTWLDTTSRLTQELRQRLGDAELAFTRENYEQVASLAQEMSAVAQTMKWSLLTQAAESVQLKAEVLPSLALVDAEAAKAHIMGNLAAMGLYIDVQTQNSRGSSRIFSFDPASQSLLVSMSTAPAFAAKSDIVDTSDTHADVAAFTAPNVRSIHETDLSNLAVQEEEDDEAMRALFFEEAGDLLSQAEIACQALERAPSELESAMGLRRCFHTLKGGARMVGLTAFGEQAWQTEQRLNAWLAETTPATQMLVEEVRQSIVLLTQQLPQPQPQPQPQLEEEDAVGLAVEQIDPVPAPPLQLIEQPADWLDLPELPASKTVGDITISLALYNAYLNEADEWSRQLAAALSEWAVDDSQPLPAQTLTWAHSLAGSSATVGFSQLAVLAKTLEQLIEKIAENAFFHDELSHCLARGADDIRRLLHQFAAGFLKEPDAQLLEKLQSLLKTPYKTPVKPEVVAFADLAAHADVSVEAAAEAPVEVLADAPVAMALQIHPNTTHQVEGDQFLAAVFAEEAAVLLPDLGTALRLWLQSSDRGDQPEQRAQALRLLHTLKGSARLVGELELADQAHLLESAIESYSELPSPEQSAALLTLYDAMHVSGKADTRDAFTPRQADDVIPRAETEHVDDAQNQAQTAADAAAAHPVSAVSPSAASVTPPVALVPSGDVIRVKLGLIDRLINQSGEIMIARARMEAEIQRGQHTLGDMGAQVVRLRDQLRELELQTESQMQSRQAQVSDQAQVFDPLEFDRFTRTQELTRFMAEALGDISTLQRSLLRALNATEDDLAAQFRQARDLQRHLLQTRMVEFDSIAERLHRLVRVTSHELGKSAELIIHGGLQEMDRSVLERVVPAFEHLLRNAIVHGIEPSSDRVAAGKPAAGQIRISLTQNGNDVLVTVQDDGQGVDAQAVKAKAMKLNPQMAASSDPAQLIFMSGLSTAASVSELAGRGIGMDVVRAQVLALGGRIEVETQPQVGTAFRLILPLTTAVTQIVLLRTGTLMTAVPANLVQTVVRAKPEHILAAEASGQWTLADGVSLCPYYSFAQLLQHHERTSPPVIPASTAVQSVVLLNSSNQTFALFVDEVLGNQEAVVKNLGPQLSQMPGLAGMTVLPTGQTVLIYNPVALATVYGARIKEAMKAQTDAAHATDDANHSAAQGDVPQAPVAPLILAVDDSITMRRVLQRLLLREGYRVVQAADGKQALELLRLELPALVLSDVEMPRMDGFELLKQIRSSERLQGLPVVMITSRIADKHRDHAKSLGANEYLGKPYPEEELVALLRKYAPV